VKRVLGRAALIALVLLAVALGAVGWHYSNEILGPDAPPVRSGQRILALDDSTIVLEATPRARRDGQWAIEWDQGHGVLGAVLDTTNGRILRRFRLASGSPPESTARLSGFARDADPRSWLGLAFEDVSIPARVGPLPGWLMPGAGSTWAIFMHGRAATRAEVLRMLEGYRALGLSCLVMSYRNDAGAPRVAEGGYRLGLTEWLDLEDAMRFALARGARDFVLVGCSTGGGIVVQCVRRSRLRSSVRAIVLDSPTLDWDAVLRAAARERRVPAALTAVGKFVTSVRTGMRWGDLVAVRFAPELGTPILIFHGERDHIVPIEVSERFAAARPDLVTLERFPDADHVESSNYDAVRYRSVLGDWLSQHGIGAAPPDTAGALVR
jgi:alpha-beta hydrolase superfamily lysophospholipase